MYASGVILESAGKFREAVAVYRQAAQIDDRHAELQFRMGRCYWETGVYDQARRSFERARDLDSLRFRADSRLNEIIRTWAATGQIKACSLSMPKKRWHGKVRTGFRAGICFMNTCI